MQCQATTLKGTQCARKVKNTNYCGQHKNYDNLIPEITEQLNKEEVKMTENKDTDTIDFYNPEEYPYGVFSNYYLRKVTIDDVIYPSTEHYYQAEKFTDLEYRKLIISMNTANKARVLAKQRISGGYKWLTDLNKYIEASLAKGITPVANWDEVKDQVMLKALRAKFSQHQDLRELLLRTGSKTIREASPRDAYWGIGKDGQGLNKLGNLLMLVREELKGK